VSDSAFTSPAHWGWLVIAYFFFGGIAGGSYALAALLDLFGRPEDRPAARLGYLVALPALAVCPPLLILDLYRPERFWHLFIMSQRPGLMFKWWSPISIGSWALLLFGGFATASFLGALAEQGSPGWIPAGLGALRRGRLGKAIAAGGAGCAFFVAGYTGVLLSVTNRPIWADTPLLGALFLVSSAAASAALLSLLAAGRGAESSLPWLARMELGAAALELAVLLAFVAWLGPARSQLGAFGPLLGTVAVVGVGVPLGVAGWRRARGASDPRGAGAALCAALVLAASLGLRAAIVLAAEALPRA
jgi:formate-dependent nitrite reductase membrane component NrfD